MSEKLTLDFGNCYEGERVIEIDKRLCIYCNSCTGVCPVMANRLRETYVEHDPQKCIDCGSCVKACPVGAITLRKGKK